MNQTFSSVVVGAVRYWLGLLWVQLAKVLALPSWPTRVEKQESWIAKIGAELLTLFSLLFSERV